MKSLILGACLLALGCDDDEKDPTVDMTAVDGTLDEGAGGTMADAGPVVDAQPGADRGVGDLGVDMNAGAAFGEACTEDDDCGSDLTCLTVGMLGLVCSRTCTEDGECPPGSMGQKCNMMGLCRP